MLFNFIFRRIITPARPYIKLQLCRQSSHYANQHSFTLTYLINSCGLSPESASLASRRLNLSKSPNTPDSVLAFLNKQGFTESQVSYVIFKYPKILLCDPEKTLLPNFQTLDSFGFLKADLVEIATAIPKSLLQTKLQDTAPQCIDYLRTVLGSDDRVIKAIKRFPLALTYDLQVYAAENIRLLLEIGVPDSTIKSVMTQQPRTFFTTADRFRKVVRDVEEMGFDPTKYRFLLAIHARRAVSESTWNTKVELYKKWGLSKDEIIVAFERCPGFMMASVDKIKRVLDFLVNTMGWETSYIVEWPVVFTFSLEKRIIPRCLVYQYVAEKGLIEENDDFSFTKWLNFSEKNFLKWIAKRYVEEASEMLKLYQKHLNDANDSTTSILRKEM